MNNQLEKLQLDLASYREAVANIFSSGLASPAKWQQCFREIVIRASQLYLDYLLVMKSLPAMEAVSSKGGSGFERAQTRRHRNSYPTF